MLGKSAIPTGTVLILSFVIKVSAYRYSFHALIKTISATEKVAGLIRGSMIVKKILPLEQPSIAAASSNPFGSCAKKFVRSQIDRGRAKVMYGMIRPAYVLRSFRFFRRR